MVRMEFVENDLIKIYKIVISSLFSCKKRYIHRFLPDFSKKSPKTFNKCYRCVFIGKVARLNKMYEI